MNPYSDYSELKNWSEDGFFKISDFERMQYDQLLKLTGGLEGDAVCEVGFGNGQLLAYLQGRNFIVNGTEIQDALIDRARRKGINATKNIEDFDPGLKFNLILAIDVLEHIPQNEIPIFLQSLKGRLLNNGKILLRFPNGDSPYGLRNQHGDFTHITTIGSKKISFLARSAGLEIYSISGEPVPKYTGLNSKKIKSILAPFFRNATRKILGNLLLLPIDKHYFSQNIICILKNTAAEKKCD